MENKRNGWHTSKHATRWHYLNGQFHREDGPAVIFPDGYQAWFRNGERHRGDGPAVSHPDGSQEWWLNGKLHREDGPAVTYPDGNCSWWLNDLEARMEDVLDTPEKREAYLLAESLRRL